MQTLCNQPLLAALPPESLGRQYLDFIKAEDLSADGLVEASEEQADALDANSDLALFATRQRDMHDLWHVLTEYGRDELGEACLLGLPMPRIKIEGLASLPLSVVSNFTSGTVSKPLNQYSVATWTDAARLGCLSKTGKPCCTSL